MNPKDKIMRNLSQYQYIKKLLGKIVKERLDIKGYTLGMLTADLLADNRIDLERLNNALQIGENNCIDFKRIFQIGTLSPKTADSRITDMLAEIKAFEFLYNHCFQDITYLRQKTSTKTVDYTSRRNEDYYAVEVTRLGLPLAEKKKPTYSQEGNLFNKGIQWFTLDGNNNIPKWEETIYSAIKNEYPQVSEFCKIKVNNWKGIVVISVGRDYFISKYARRDMFLPKTLSNVIQTVFNNLKQTGNYKYLQHLILVIGKYPNQIFTYPTFN